MGRLWRELILLFLLASIMCLQAQASDLAVERKVYDYLTNEMELSSAAACGILANIEQESGFRPNALGDHDTSYGLCQWHDTRYENLKTFCISMGLDYRSVEGQMAFLIYELRSSYYSLLVQMRTVSNDPDGAYRAAHMWCIQFERPANMEELAVQRGLLARGKYWNRYNGLVLVQDNDSDMTVEEVIWEIQEPEEVVIPEPVQGAVQQNRSEEPQQATLPLAPYIPRHRPKAKVTQSFDPGIAPEFAVSVLFMPMVYEERHRIRTEAPEETLRYA